MGKYALTEQEREWLDKRIKTSRCALYSTLEPEAISQTQEQIAKNTR